LACVALLVSGVRVAFAIPADDLLRSLQPTADVNDFAGVLSSSERAGLEEKCRQLRARTGAQLGVAIVRSLEGGQIDDFAVKLFHQWRIGQENKNNGVLLLVAIEDRKAKIEVGYGLEHVLPDILAGRILREQLFPAFREQRYAAGLNAAVGRIVEIIERNEPVDAKPAPFQPIQGFPFEALIIVLLFLIFWVSPLSYSAGTLLRDKEVEPAISRVFFAVLAVVVPLCLGMPLLAQLVVAACGVVAGILGYNADRDEIDSRGRRSRRSTGRDRWFDDGPWVAPSSDWGGGGFSGGGGGSWGGFGGGSSGGGGASGGW
jgi:uncharacterized protein